MIYYSYFLFSSNYPAGIEAGDRWKIGWESGFRWFVDALLFYHFLYEFLQLIRFGGRYFADQGNYFDLFGLILNVFILQYHVFDGHFMHTWIVPMAALAMSIMWI